jgi:hypothetical protein
MRLTPHACMATNSRSLDSRPNATSSPSSSDIGIVSPSAWGKSVITTWRTTIGETPLEMNCSAISIRKGIMRMNVKTRRPSVNGHRTSRMT